MNDSNIEIGIRIPPQAIDVEQGLLGSMLWDTHALTTCLDKLVVADFYESRNSIIFEAIQEVVQKNIKPDLLSVEQRLRDKEILEKVTSTYIADLSRSTGTSSNTDYYIQILKDKTMLRNLIRCSTEAVKLSYNPDVDPFDVIDLLTENAKSIEKDGVTKIPHSTSKGVADILRSTLEETNVRNEMVGLPAYLPIDRLTAGFPKSELIYIAARPSMGKTAYMLTIIRNQLLNKLPEPIVIFSFEMEESILLLRLLCMIAKVNMQFARRGKLEDPEKKRLVEAAELMGVSAIWNHKTKKLEVNTVENSILFIDDDPDNDPESMKSKIRAIENEHGQIGVVMVDYLQLMQVRGSKAKNIGTREQEVSYCSRRMKAQSKEFDCPYVVLSQLSRAVESRSGDNRPILSDLRESGSIEQDATMVMFLYRPEYYDIVRTEEGISTAGLCEVILRKNRNGPTGTEMHSFTKEFASFDEWEAETAALAKGSSDPRPDQQWMVGKDDPGDRHEHNLDDKMPF